MLKLLFRRLIIGLVTFWVSTLVIFALLELMPGDFATARVQRLLQADLLVSSDLVANIRKSHGLDRPAYIRYVEWLGGALSGDLGRSWSNGREIAPMVAGRLTNSLFLALMTALCAVPIAVGLGIYSAVRRNTFVDRLIVMLATCAYAVPEFAMGYFLAALLAVQAGLFPSMALFPMSATWGERFAAIGLPVLTLTLIMTAGMLRPTRAVLIEVMTRPFIETAVLKGLTTGRIVIFHALPHAVGPVINVVILALAHLITGLVIVEIIFVYPGVGQIMIDAVRTQNLPVMQACGLALTSIYIGLVMLADFITLLSNPRLAERVGVNPAKRLGLGVGRTRG